VISNVDLLTGLAAGVSVASAAALLGLARVARWRTRVFGTCFILAANLGVMLAQPFRPRAMGDYSVYVKNRFFFEYRFGNKIEFQYHLSGVIVHGLDAAFGRTAKSPVEAFHTLARLASFVFVLGLVLLALQQGFSSRVIRYLALAVAAPPTLLLFGYNEFGYLPGALIVCAIPLAFIGLERENDGFVLAGAVLLGVGAALHGFGLVAAGFLLLVVLIWERKEPRRMASRLVQVVGGVSFGWLSWLALYFMFLSLRVLPGNADFRPIRPLFHTGLNLDGHRYDYAVFSRIGLRDIFFEFVILGVFVSAFMLLFTRGDRLWEAVAVASVPVVLFVIFFWPVQGLGNDTDFLGSAFPPLYAAGWLASRSKRLSLVAVAILGLSQLAMLYVVHSNAFVHARDF
jgi:hypothetical protein